MIIALPNVPSGKGRFPCCSRRFGSLDPTQSVAGEQCGKRSRERRDACLLYLTAAIWDVEGTDYIIEQSHIRGLPAIG